MNRNLVACLEALRRAVFMGGAGFAFVWGVLRLEERDAWGIPSLLLTLPFIILSFPLRRLIKGYSHTGLEGLVLVILAVVTTFFLQTIAAPHVPALVSAAVTTSALAAFICGSVAVLGSPESKAVVAEVTSFQWSLLCVLLLLSTTWSFSLNDRSAGRAIQLTNGFVMLLELILLTWAFLKLAAAKSGIREQTLAWSIVTLGFGLWLVLYKLVSLGKLSEYLGALAALLGTFLVGLVIDNGLKRLPEKPRPTRMRYSWVERRRNMR